MQKGHPVGRIFLVLLLIYELKSCPFLHFHHTFCEDLGETFLGLISVVLILTGGFKWMTSMGNKDKIDEAKKLIKNSIIGLAVILFSYAITNFVITGLIG